MKPKALFIAIVVMVTLFLDTTARSLRTAIIWCDNAGADGIVCVYFIHNPDYVNMDDRIQIPDASLDGVAKGLMEIDTGGMIFKIYFPPKYLIYEIFPKTIHTNIKFLRDNKILSINRSGRYYYYYNPDGFSQECRVRIFQLYSVSDAGR